MEFAIKCPDCGKTLKITVEEENSAKTKIVRHTATPTTWDEIASIIRSGKAKECFSVEDVVPVKLKNGEIVNAVVAEIDPYGENEIAFVIEDCLKERHVMNKEWTNKGGWRDCEMRKYLNGTIYDLLPDDLKAVIANRIITQEIDGEEYDSEDALWLLSMTEIGEEYETDVGDVAFSLFKDERSRVKQINGETVFWWLRSPFSGTSNYFCLVSASGSSAGSGAYSSLGVAFGFLVR